MNLLYVLRYYPTLSETFVYREMTELIRRGHRVSAVALGARSDGALQDEVPAIEVVRPPRGLAASTLLLDAPTAASAPFRALAQHTRLKDVLRAAWVTRWARHRGFDRIHVHFAGEAAEWAVAVGAALDLPVSITVHAVDLYKPRPSLPHLTREARPLVTIARRNQDLLLERYGARSVLVRCGVDPTRYAPARPDRAGEMGVVAIGRWVPKKGFDQLVRVIPRVPGARLRLVSDPPAGAVGPEVEVGPLPPSAIPRVLAAHQVLALPCRVADDGDQDGVPVVIMEAMAAGLPVIAGDVGGVGELVDDEVGWLLPPGDERALEAALRAAVADPAARRRKGDAGRRRVIERGFTVEAQVDGLLRAWASA